MNVSRTIPHCLALASGDGAMAAAAAWLAAISEQERWPVRRAARLHLVLEEALTNVLEHGLRSPPPPPMILVEYVPGEAGVVLRLTDNGRCFDPNAAPLRPLPADLDTALIGGHGIRLMRHYARAMKYRRRGELNELTLFME